MSLRCTMQIFFPSLTLCVSGRLFESFLTIPSCSANTHCFLRCWMSLQSEHMVHFTHNIWCAPSLTGWDCAKCAYGWSSEWTTWNTIWCPKRKFWNGWIQSAQLHKESHEAYKRCDRINRGIDQCLIGTHYCLPWYTLTGQGVKARLHTLTCCLSVSKQTVGSYVSLFRPWVWYSFWTSSVSCD